MFTQPYLIWFLAGGQYAWLPACCISRVLVFCREGARNEVRDVMKACIKYYLDDASITNATEAQLATGRKSCEENAREAFKEAGGNADEFETAQRY